MSIVIYTSGCRLNFAETEELIDILGKKKINTSLGSKKIIIIRSCSVTKKAEKESQIKINQIRKKEKKAFIIAAGCLSKNFIAPAADLILEKRKEKKLIPLLLKFVKKRDSVGEQFKKKQLRTRSFIKIQDGCSNHCTYCLITILRGQEKSKKSWQIIKTIKEKEKQGFQEIVLTGVNIVNWRERDKDFVWLFKKILKETSILRIRISSCWPDKINEKFLNLFENKRLGRHLHLSLQSLSDSVLRRMGRIYKKKIILKKIFKIKKRFPDLSISADVIVGFPGETAKEFNQTVNAIRKIGLFKIHVFRFSARQGTKASIMLKQVNQKIKKERSRKMLALSEELNKKWCKKFIGQKREVLFEQKKNGFWQGLTDNYLRVFSKSKKNLSNKILLVKLKEICNNGILGEILKDAD